MQPLEKAMAPHSSTLSWKIPWMEEPGGLQSMGSRRVGHDWATSLSLFPFMHWRRKWQPTPVFLPEESQGQRSLVGCRLWGRTWLKRLSSSSSSSNATLALLFLLQHEFPWVSDKPQCFSVFLQAKKHHGLQEIVPWLLNFYHKFNIPPATTNVAPELVGSQPWLCLSAVGEHAGSHFLFLNGYTQDCWH